MTPNMETTLAVRMPRRLRLQINKAAKRAIMKSAEWARHALEQAARRPILQRLDLAIANHRGSTHIECGEEAWRDYTTYRGREVVVVPTHDPRSVRTVQR